MNPLTGSVNDLGFVYIAERTSPEENFVKNFEVIDKKGIFFVRFDTCLHSFDVMNRNERMYEASNIAECMKTDRIAHYLSHGGWFGEQNHPIPVYQNVKLSPERIQDIDMNNTSHKMLNPHITGNLLVSTVESDAGTAQGMNLARKMVQGFIPGFSCRAIAYLTMKNGKPVVVVKKIITYDWVLYQSHREAEQLKGTPTQFVKKSAPAGSLVRESYEKSDDVVIPLKEILLDVGKTDVNTQIIMESFGLDMDNLVGFSKDHNQIMIENKGNMIYCNIDMKAKNKVNEYLRSF